MELMEVNVEDVYPDEKNPRKDFGDIAALAESCMLNAVSPGEPVNPIVVVRDGGIYRIVDGERRYKAMCKNKVKRCHAVVCDGMDEANAMVAMVATDDKQRLTDIERSRGVQQMLLLGVDPAKVERTARMAKGSAWKVATAMATVDDAAEDMTLDRMLAIAEFAEAGDDEAVADLTDCPEKDWPRIAAEYRGLREREAEVAAVTAACEAAGVAVADEKPDGMAYAGLIVQPEHVAERLEGRDPSDFAAVPVNKSYAYGVELYERRVEKAPDPEAEERKRRTEEMGAMIEHGSQRRAAWYASCIAPNQYNPIGRRADTPNVDAYLLGRFFRAEECFQTPIDGVDAFLALAGADAADLSKDRLQGRMAAYIYGRCSAEINRNYAHPLAHGTDGVSDWTREMLGRFAEWASLCAADGYVPDDADKAVLAAVEKLLGAAENDGEGE